jgi:protein SCO1
MGQGAASPAPAPRRAAAALRRWLRHAALALGCALALLGAAQADEAPATPGLDATEAWRVSQSALGREIGDFALLDRAGQPLRLAAYRGKPLLVSFIYTGCFQVCPTNTRSLHEAVLELQRRFGAHRFNVVSIGFNQPADSPQAMKAFAAEQRIDAPDWNFLSPHPATLEGLTADFGFRWRATPAGFDHVLQLSVVDARGRLVRQFYGDRAPPEALAELLQQLFAGAPLPEPTPLASFIDRVRILCTVYDPKTGSYRVDYSLALEIAGGLTFVLAMALYALNEWLQRWRAARLTHRKTLAPSPAQTAPH